MIRLVGPGSQLCDGRSRRDILRIGGIGLLGAGLGLPELVRAANSTTGGKAKSCIVLFLMGGPPQHSTWDPKPDAPTEIRGEFGPIETNVPGVRVSSLFPRIARHADKLCILRAVAGPTPWIFATGNVSRNAFPS